MWKGTYKSQSWTTHVQLKRNTTEGGGVEVEKDKNVDANSARLDAEAVPKRGCYSLSRSHMC